MISVVVPFKNRIALLKETITSVLAQTYGDWELLLVNDSSSELLDELQALIEGDDRIRLMSLPEDKEGAPAARNFGAHNSQGNFIIFLDSDDLLTKTCLAERRQATVEHPDLDFLVFNCAVFQESPGDTGMHWNRLEGDQDDLTRYLKLDVVWQTASVIWKKESIVKLGLWNESCLSFQDWELHARALIEGLKYIKLDQTDVFYRLNSTDNIRTKNGSIAHVHSRHKALQMIYSLYRNSDVSVEDPEKVFAALYFWIARSLARGKEFKAAVAAWREALHHRLIGKCSFCRGVFLVSLGRISNTLEHSFCRWMSRCISDIFKLKIPPWFQKIPAKKH